ncbi:MAG: DUF362 domain-containing protein [candidate division KSB1 bacterium]|nr:DUF362 domain-containing protein [candidate division KSB1 bacterium]
MSSVVLPFIVAFWQRLLQFLKNEYLNILKLILAATVLFMGYQWYRSFKENELRLRGSRTIPQVLSLISPSVKAAILEERSPTVPILQTVVSFRYEPAVTYGNSLPYDRQENPAYDLVWQTVMELGLGDSNSPLDSLIKEGDTVLIKPNLLEAHGAAYTQPSVVRPLIDMAIRAGATTIYVGDGSPSYDETEAAIAGAHYDELVSTLQSAHPEITIETINLDERSSWHWVYLGSASSFAGSGYSDYDLASSNKNTLFNTHYYATADPQGVNPKGQVLGWYAMSGGILRADVVINVPKMKNHWNMINTLAIKNLVGTTVACTYDHSNADYSRIPHFRTQATGNELYFANDIYWRSILDVNKILLYADKQGHLQTTPQRKYLCVLDGIQANEQDAAGDNPYDRKVVLASIDPVALDAVASRVMGYDFNAIWGIKKMTSETVYPIGTHDPNRVVVVGDPIDSRFNYIFKHDPDWDQYAASEGLDLSDFTPPTINNVDIVGGLMSFNVTAEISAALTAYLLYETEKGRSIQKMTKSGPTFSAELPVNNGKLKILTQDEHFNTIQKTVVTTFTQNIASGNIDPVVLGNTDVTIDFASGPGGKITVYRYHSKPPQAGPQVLSYYWEIISNLTPHSFNAELSFDYDEAELANVGLTESELVIAYYDNGWHPLSTTINTEKNKVSTTITHFARFAIGNETSVPVEWSYFSAEEKDGKVILNWCTQTETNCYGFGVERSQDNINFKKVGFVKGKETTIVPQSYEFVDTAISVGTYYYRLKQIDNDGTFQYSQTIKVVVNAPLTFMLEQNYPNPYYADEQAGQTFNAGTYIRYRLSKPSQVTIKIFNLMGQEIRMIENQRKEPGYFTVLWDGKDNQGQPVASGVYLYTIQAGELVDSRKMLFIR